MGLIQAMLITVMLLPAGNTVTVFDDHSVESNGNNVAVRALSKERSDRKVLMNNKVIEYKKTFYIT